jgi:pentatricopeptide repeat protein
MKLFSRIPSRSPSLSSSLSPKTNCYLVFTRHNSKQLYFFPSSLNASFSSTPSSTASHHHRAHPSNNQPPRLSPKEYLDQIHSLIQNSKPSEAQEILSQMIAARYRPRISTINLILKSYSKKCQPEKGEKLWKEMRTKFQLAPDVITYTSLMSGYAALSNFQSCLRLLEEMKVVYQIQPNVYTYTTLIAAYSRAHLPQQAEAHLLEMIQNGVVPSIASYNSVLHGYVVNLQPLEAYRLFLELHQSSILAPDRTSYSTLLKGLGEKNYPEEMEHIYSLMEKASSSSSAISPPTQRMYHQLVGCYCQSSQPLLAYRCMTNLISSGTTNPSIFTYSILIQAFIQVGDYSKIDLLLEEMRGHEREGKLQINEITYESIIRSLCQRQRPDLAKEYHWEMIGKGLRPSEQCLGYLLKTYSLMKQPQQGENFIHELLTCTHPSCQPPTRSCYRILVTSYCISSQPMEAERVSLELKFQERIQVGDVKSRRRLEKYLYSSLIKAYVRTGYPLEAERIFREMLSEYYHHPNLSQEPTSQQHQQSEEAKAVTAPERDLLLSNQATEAESSLTAMYNQLMKGYLAECSLDNMLRIFEEMKSRYFGQRRGVQVLEGVPDVATYHFLMRYYSRVSEPMKAEELLQEMIQLSKATKSSHLIPEKLSYDLVISGYAKIGMKKTFPAAAAAADS